MRRLLVLLLASAIGAGVSAAVRAVFPAETPAASAEAAQAQRAAPDDAAEPPTATTPAPEPPYPTGYIVRGRRVTVQMSDGTTRIEHTPDPRRDGMLAPMGEVTDIDRNAVLIDGRKWHLKPAPKPGKGFDQSPIKTDSTAPSGGAVGPSESPRLPGM